MLPPAITPTMRIDSAAHLPALANVEYPPGCVLGDAQDDVDRCEVTEVGARERDAYKRIATDIQICRHFLTSIPVR
jgi:hypothetical protein